jgi:predicted murein hydrolase (TIGR00659 family)
MGLMLHDIWIALSLSPAFGIAITLICYQFGCRLQSHVRGNPLCNPVLVSIASIIAVLLLTGTEYQVYFRTAGWLHFLLGPATVALAIPLYKNLGEIRQAALAIGTAVTAGAIVASGSAVAIAWLLGASPSVLRSIAPKSVTTPIAIAVSAQIGGIPDLTAVLVVATGVVGALWAPEITLLLGVRSWRARGLAAGVAGHGIATARMLSVNETAGAFAGLAMGLCGLVTAVLLPLALGGLSIGMASSAH